MSDKKEKTVALRGEKEKNPNKTVFVQKGKK